MIRRVASWLKMVHESVDLRAALLVETVRADVAEESARQIKKAYKGAIQSVVRLNESLEVRKEAAATFDENMSRLRGSLNDARRELAVSKEREAELQKSLDEVGSDEALAWYKARVVVLEADLASRASELSRVREISDGYLKEARLSVEAKKQATISALQNCKFEFNEKIKRVNPTDVYPIGGIEIPAYQLLTWVCFRIGDMIDGKPIQDPARK